MKDKKKIIIYILIIMELSFIFLSFKAYSNQKIEEIKEVNKVEKEQFSMYIEQADGTYKREKKTKYFPSSGYVLNEEKTYCEDTKGNEIKDAVSFNNGKITMTSNKTIYCTLYMNKICSVAEDTEVAAGSYGAKYNCKVDPNKPEYTFYLLGNNSDGTSNLIMNANINAQGEAVIPGVTIDIGTVAWYAKEKSNNYGPVTAFEYLHNATKSWTNVDPINYIYNDQEAQGIDETVTGYATFVSIDGIAIITAKDGITTNVIGTVSEPLRSRLPYHSNISGVQSGEVINRKVENSFLYINLSDQGGYWTLSSSGSLNHSAWRVFNDNNKVTEVSVLADIYYGVRPVITVKL